MLEAVFLCALPQADLWKVKNPGEMCRKQPFICSKRGILPFTFPFTPSLFKNCWDLEEGKGSFVNCSQPLSNLIGEEDLVQFPSSPVGPRKVGPQGKVASCPCSSLGEREKERESLGLGRGL